MSLNRFGGRRTEETDFFHCGCAETVSWCIINVMFCKVSTHINDLVNDLAFLLTEENTKARSSISGERVSPKKNVVECDSVKKSVALSYSLYI